MYVRFIYEQDRVMNTRLKYVCLTRFTYSTGKARIYILKYNYSADRVHDVTLGYTPSKRDQRSAFDLNSICTRLSVRRTRCSTEGGLQCKVRTTSQQIVLKLYNPSGVSVSPALGGVHAVILQRGAFHFEHARAPGKLHGVPNCYE